MKIGIFHDQKDKVNGCWKVVHNLLDGLRLLGHDVLSNEQGKLNGCLQRKASVNAPSSALLGPEIVVLPTEDMGLFQRFKHWAQPSQWVTDYMNTYPLDNHFHIWPSGIDTDRFTPDRKPKYDCLIYYKNVTHQTPVELVFYAIEKLKQNKQTYRVIEYGKYTEDEFVKELNSCRYCMWLVGTESQNIAIMEAWSMDVPTYILNQSTFMYGKFQYSNGNVSSAPYFNLQCGRMQDSLKDLPSFVEEVPMFTPRSYVVGNYNLKTCADWYVKLLEIANG